MSKNKCNSSPGQIMQTINKAERAMAHLKQWKRPRTPISKLTAFKRATDSHKGHIELNKILTDITRQIKRGNR